jgi:hypothetical protein
VRLRTFKKQLEDRKKLVPDVTRKRLEDADNFFTLNNALAKGDKQADWRGPDDVPVPIMVVNLTDEMGPEGSFRGTREVCEQHAPMLVNVGQLIENS